MSKSVYTPPAISDLASFADSTNGWFAGDCRDIFGGRAFLLC